MKTSKNRFWSHKTAEVSPKAKIGRGTKIWHNSQVLAGAKIGKDCTIGHNCLIGEKVKIGNNVKIQSNTDVWSRVTLEDYVFAGPSAVFTNDLNPRSKYPKPKNKWLPTRVQKGATIGANSTIVCGNTIGKWAFIGAGAVVIENVPDYAIVAGVPATIIGWMCECGTKLEFKLTKPAKLTKGNKKQTEKAICKACGRRYKKKNKKVTNVK